LTTFGLVENLCMVCERGKRSSFTFRLPTERQSETIPRCLKAAERVQRQSTGRTQSNQGRIQGRRSEQEPESL